jgi:hypothetical protein
MTVQVRRFRAALSLAGASDMRLGRSKIALASLLVVTALGGLARFSSAKPLDQAAFDALYKNPATVAPGPQRVFHIGHSLVGRDMPAMLAQLAGQGHHYDSQLGWGTTLKAHWDPDEPINGFEAENAHPRYRDAHQAVDSGDYDALILTEMVEIRDAIKYFDSPTYLRHWLEAGWAANPDLRIFLYETWHQIDDPEGWLTRLDRDLTLYWEDGVLRPALGGLDTPRPVYIIPAGQVMARFARALDDSSGVDGIATYGDLFTDQIHLNDLGSYLVALTHYAVLYQRSPVGLPHDLSRADGTPADAPGPQTARLMQEIVWDVVTAEPNTGVPRGTP